MVRAGLCCVLVAAGFAHAAEREYAFGGPWPEPAPPPPPVRYAAGSAVGPWSFLELGTYLGAGTFVDPRYYASAGLWTSLTAGWGVEVNGVHLRPSARFGLVVVGTLPDVETGQRFLATPVALSLAATNLLDEPRTGLRLTPAVGLTVPTSLGRSIPLTTLSLALQLERRFGPVELALRSEAGKPLYPVYLTSPSGCSWCPIEEQPSVNWTWVNRLQAEGWITDSLSLGLSLAWNIAWGFPITDGAVTTAGRRDTTTGRVFVSWAFARLFGLSLEVDTTQPPFTITPSGVRALRFPFLSFGTWADNRSVLLLSVWFRTDVTLAREWIER